MSFALAHGHFVCLHACAYGGERKKNTAFLCSNEEFWALEKFVMGHIRISSGDMTMRRASSTQPKKLSTQGHYVNSMPISCSAWFLELWSDNVLRIP